MNNSASGTNYNFSYVFNYTDHLGNIRLSYSKLADNTMKILEENHYYPFGLKHENYNSDGFVLIPGDPFNLNEGMGVMAAAAPEAPQPMHYDYKYNGKELQDELGLNIYDYGARNYDAAIGRFFNIDRFAEKYHNVSTYGYSGNNPVLFNDVQGDSIGVGKDLFEKFRQGVLDRKNKIISDRASRINKAKSEGDNAKADKLAAKFAKEDEKKNSAINILNSTLSELSTLESSSQVYNLFENSSAVPSTANGNVTYDISSNAVNVNSKSSFSMGIFGHELKHAYQFQIGNLSFGTDGQAGGQLYDRTDEYEAFDRGSFFGGSSPSRDEIDAIYQNIPSNFRSLQTTPPGGFTSYGNQFKFQTYNSSSRGTAQQQFYINWQNDKKK